MDRLKTCPTIKRMHTLPRIFALIPAAGKSVRMGRPKLALPLGDRTVLEPRHRGAAWRWGPRHPGRPRPARRRAGRQGQRRRCGSAGTRRRNARHARHPRTRTSVAGATSTASCRRFFPLATRRSSHPGHRCHWRLCRASRQHPEASILVPTFAGKRGHPTLIGWHHVPGIRTWPANEGLNAYLRQQQVHEVEVNTEEVLRDLDTPEDYKRLQ